MILTVLVGSGVFFIQQEVQKIPIPVAPDMPLAKSQTMQGRQQAVDLIMEGKVGEAESETVEQAQLAPKPRPAPIVRQRLYRDVQKQDRKIDLSKPTKALETHFAQKARKNENVLALERKLVQASKSGDLTQSKQLLSSMSVEIGKKESASKYKWEGYLALQEKRYADAENFFRRAVAIRTTDYVSNINLVYALLGQGKRQDAVRIYRQLIDRYPMNERVQKLGKSLGEL
ncbi:tetratricopeptide repeat protein [Desulfovibrio ferrophilus]|uniref:tetratricopeptide repeat protein n=1 Tax=Desulfovibrio ferrophilus TaxID=241368 RepID=UPI000F83BED2|nr:tetratricopeptide repeat protein [Desulfovibrio ferrophilus]